VKRSGRHAGDAGLQLDVDAVTDRIGRPFRRVVKNKSWSVELPASFASQVQRSEMAVDDDGSGEAVGSEKSPRNVRRFVWAPLFGIAIFLALVLLYLHLHAPVISH
jgi:hypothetical protein